MPCQDARVKWIALALALAAGCGHSVLIPRGDDTYRRAIEHYQRTRQLVAASLAPEDDQAMFMQAEALFRYRFAPHRSTGALFAELAASATDLPMIEAVAGSLDLFALRLKTNDGAIQLWETLLDRSPATPLRALALYRLGWAYRNHTVTGFVGSTDVVFDALAREFPGSELAELGTAAKQVPYKSPTTATAWSIFPGAGQIYAGETRNGLVRLAIAVGAASAIIVPSVVAYESNDLTLGSDWPLLVTGIVGATVLAVDYTNSYNDALRAVLEYNERSERAFEDAHPGAP
jgi:hypothetical protein